MTFDISTSEHARRISERDGFHDVLTSAWPLVKNKPGVLTGKQRAWVEAYFKTFDEGTGIPPTAGDVAAVLGVTASISARMRRRIMEALRPIASREDADGSRDMEIEAAYRELEEDVKKAPPYLEKVRGVSGVVLWQHDPDYHVHHKRTGRTYATAHKGETISKKKAKALGLPTKITRHGPSPGHQWWNDRILEACERSGGSYSDEYRDLMGEAYGRWPDEKPHKERFCQLCGCLLPLGERVNGKLIKLNSKYCSDRCKTYSKRK